MFKYFLWYFFKLYNFFIVRGFPDRIDVAIRSLKPIRRRFEVKSRAKDQNPFFIK